MGPGPGLGFPQGAQPLLGHIQRPSLNGQASNGCPAWVLARVGGVQAEVSPSHCELPSQVPAPSCWTGADEAWLQCPAQAGPSHPLDWTPAHLLRGNSFLAKGESGKDVLGSTAFRSVLGWWYFFLNISIAARGRQALGLGGQRSQTQKWWGTP